MRANWLAIIVGILASAPSYAFLPPAHDDAPLRCVGFFHRDHGLAAGDQGTVWLTLDRGKTWEQAKSGTRASLRGLCILDELHAWIAGRKELPGGAGSVGVVLKSQDGGLTWAEANETELPGLNGVQFFDESRGLAFGDGSARCPSGVFATSDGGKTWASVAGSKAATWHCAHWAVLNRGCLGGPASQLVAVAEGRFERAECAALGGRSVRSLAFDGPDGIAVGEGGLLLTTTTAGAKWTAAESGLSAKAQECIDFHAVVRSGKTAWAVGRPGSLVLKTTDGGTTWAKCFTNWPLPLNGLCASTDDELFAVGEFGAILHSADAGKTWTVQRCGGRRSAVLFASHDAKSIPLEAVASLGGRDGYLTHALAMTRVDGADAKSVQDPFRLHAAVRAVGGASSEVRWAFPLSRAMAEADTIGLLKALDDRLDGRADDRLVGELVLALRMWMPEAVASDRLDPSATPAEQLVLSCTKKAFKLADDPKVYPEQLDELGLKPWAAKKLYALAPAKSPEAPVKMDATIFARHLVNTVQGHAETGCAVLGDGCVPAAQRNFVIVSHRSPGSEKHDSIAGGFLFGEGGAARRMLPKFDPSLDDLLAKAKKASEGRRMLEAIVGGSTTNAEAERAMTAAHELLRTLPEDVAAKAAVGVGRQLAAEGKWLAAREMNLIVASKYLGYPESAEAVRWLTRYYGSSEARHRAELAQCLVLQYAVPTTISKAGGSIQQAGFVEPILRRDAFKLTSAEAAQAWNKAALEMDEKLRSFGATYAGDPALKLANLSARRTLSLTGDAAEQVSQYFKQRPAAADAEPGDDLWRDSMAAEAWLLNRKTIAKQPKPFAYLPKVANKPYLDGQLDDECWKAMKPLSCPSTTGDAKDFSTEAYFAFDDEFLYVGFDCKHPEGRSLPKAKERKRDDDLRGRDRVDLLLDLDRDYQTYFRIQVDQTGRVAEDCCGDGTWNPRYFVAVEPSTTGWTAEIAIPRTELTNAPFKAGSTWAMNVTRVIPGKACQSWSGPADATPRPEGMGLLQFHAK